MSNLKSGARKALVIGNATYGGALALRNPVRDAELFAEALKKLAFKVDLLIDLDTKAFVDAVARFTSGLADTDVSVFFYAGHGAQVNGFNFLIPVGCEPSTYLQLETEAIKLQTLLDTLGKAAPTSIFFLDCCRNNPLPRRLSDAEGGRALPAKGLASPRVPNGSYIAFSTMNDAIAEDGEGPNSIFSDSLSRNIDLQDKSISDIMASVRYEVRTETNGRQIPMDWSTLVRPFIFNSTGRQPSPLQTSEEQQEELWGYVRDSNNIDQLESFILRYPTGKYRQSASEKRDHLYRRSIYRKMSNGIKNAAGVIVIFAIGYILLSYSRFDTHEGYDLVGGDISLPVGSALASTSLTHERCKLSCVLTPSCIAYTYDTNNKGCYLKNDYMIRLESSNHISGYIPRPAFANFKKRDLSAGAYRIDYERIYTGTALDTSGKPLGKINLNKEPERTAEWLFGKRIDELKDSPDAQDLAKDYRSGSTFCQALCNRLPTCRAFNYTTLHHRCKLLGDDDPPELAVSFGRYRSIKPFFPSVMSGRKPPLATGDETSGMN